MSRSAELSDSLKHADRSVWNEDSRFRTIFEQSPVSTQIFAPNGDTLAVNPAWEELWGVTLAQIGGYNILDDEQLVDKGVMPSILAGFAGEPTRIPTIKYEPSQTVVIDGAVTHRWVSAFIYPVRDGDGVIREVVLTHEDITEQRHAEEALRESETRFRTMFQGAPVGISLMDREGRYLAVNPVRQRMLGYREDELVGRSYLEFTHNEDIERDQQVNDEARRDGSGRVQLEKRFVSQDGSVQWARITAALVKSDDGEPQYSISIAEDITQRKQAERERARLYELEREARAHIERLAAEREAILGQIAEGLIITDPVGNIVFINRHAEALHGVADLGVPVAEYTQRFGLLTVNGEPYPVEQLPLSRAVIDGTPVIDAEWRIRRPDGTEVIVQGSAVPVVGDDGVRLGAVLTVRDVTAQHVMEEQKDQFLSALAHDLRTPLTTVKGRVQMLRRRAEVGTLDTSHLADDLARIDANTSRMIALISELLEVANIQFGRPLNLVRRRTDLISLVRQAVHEYQQATDRHSITLDTQVEELVGQWDPLRLERVLANLLSNAVKYSPGGGSIIITIAGETDHGQAGASLAVIDHGVGIPVSDLPHVFERFHRGSNVTGKMPGTGIGLAAVRDIVEQSGGTVSVTSVEGQGTTFRVWLPLDHTSSVPA